MNNLLVTTVANHVCSVVRQTKQYTFPLSGIVDLDDATREQILAEVSRRGLSYEPVGTAAPHSFLFRAS